MKIPPPRQILDDIALCLVFFTRLPFPQFDLGGRVLAQAIWAAPLAGIVVALIGGIAYAVAALSGLSAGVAAALALTATMLATGCLHEDGLSDTADGFGGGRAREKKLEIMRDSRIGAYGASALTLSALIRWSAISDLASPAHVFCGLVAAHAASRALLPALMHMLPAARADGLAANAGSVSRETAIAGAAIGAVSLLFLGLSGAIPAVLCLALAFFAFRMLCRNQIGGQTGDTLGAMQQIGEVTVLVVASAIFH
jgi:adenosylcobinamide-GDP ribazoletransferase